MFKWQNVESQREQKKPNRSIGNYQSSVCEEPQGNGWFTSNITLKLFSFYVFPKSSQYSERALRNKDVQKLALFLSIDICCRRKY